MEKKAWYRTLKVVYIVIYVFAIIAVCNNFWENKPTQTYEYSLQDIDTELARRQSQEKPKKYFLDIPEGFEIVNQPQVRESPQSTNLPAGYILDQPQEPTAQPRDLFEEYGIEPPKHTSSIGQSATKEKYGKYAYWVGDGIFAFFILWITAYLIRIGFFYIVIGEKPQRNFPK